MVHLNVGFDKVQNEIDNSFGGSLTQFKLVIKNTWECITRHKSAMRHYYATDLLYGFIKFLVASQNERIMAGSIARLALM